MKEDAIGRRLQREFARQAAAVPVRKGDPAELERMVAEIKARDASVTGETPSEPEPETLGELAVLFVEKMKAMQARHPAAAEEAVRAAQLREDFERLEKWGFAERYRREIVKWECEPQRRVFEKCRETLTGVGAIVALIGKRGTGKTTIAAQLALDRLRWERRQRVKFPGLITTFIYRKTTGLVSRFKPLYANFGALNVDALEESRARLCGRETDVLVIDELHDLSELAVREALLIDMIDRRYSSQRDTLLISNQTLEEFERETPASIRSRIHEHGVVIPCEWESWRDER